MKEFVRRYGLAFKLSSRLRQRREPLFDRPNLSMRTFHNFRTERFHQSLHRCVKVHVVGQFQIFRRAAVEKRHMKARNVALAQRQVIPKITDLRRVGTAYLRRIRVVGPMFSHTGWNWARVGPPTLGSFMFAKEIQVMVAIRFV